VAINDVTEKIERLEVFEERLGVSFQGISAFMNYIGDPTYLRICGELLPINGTNLSSDVEIVVAVYDKSGRIIATQSYNYFAEDFFGLETFEFLLLSVAQVRSSSFQ
jgi:hypothetical protein